MTSTSAAELFRAAMSTLNKVQPVTISNIHTAQDAMLNLHVAWESLQKCLRNKKIEGYDPVIENMEELAAVAVAMSAALRAKIVDQRKLQFEQEFGEDKRK